MDFPDGCPIFSKRVSTFFVLILRLDCLVCLKSRRTQQAGLNPTSGNSNTGCSNHKVLTYIEYRACSVWRLPNYWPPPPLHSASVSSRTPPLHQRRGGGGTLHTRRAVRGWGGVNISEDSRHWIGLLQNNPLYAPNHTFSVLWLQNMSGILVLNMNV
jgi:hypothetical protein